MFRGWDDRVTWSLCDHLSEMMPVWIDRMRKDAIGYPVGPEFDGLTEKEAVAKWDGILKEIRDGFAAYQRETEVDPRDPEFRQKLLHLQEIRDRGIELFKTYFANLWW